MIPYMVGKLAPNSSHLTRGLVKYVPGRSYFRAVPSQNGDKYVTSPPPPQSMNLSVEPPSEEEEGIGERPPANTDGRRAAGSASLRVAIACAQNSGSVQT